VQPLGESTPVPVDVRVITATQAPLERAVAENRFRADLFARLAGAEILLPPLRDRREDVPGLFARMLERHLDGPPPPVEARLIEQLCLHDWPFNVREVDHLANKLASLHGHEPVLRREHLPKSMRSAGERPSPWPEAPGVGAQPGKPPDESQLRHEQELEKLKQALRLHGGNVTRAARELGISRQKAYRLMGPRGPG
jgi:DNA-binding NtrC family response regulator